MAISNMESVGVATHKSTITIDLELNCPARLDTGEDVLDVSLGGDLPATLGTHGKHGHHQAGEDNLLHGPILHGP